MCFSEKIFNILNYSILFGSIILVLIYLFFILKSKNKRKHYLKFLIISLVFLLIINLGRILLIKSCSKKAITVNVNTITNVMPTNEISTTTATTATTTMTKTTTKKIIKDEKVEYKNGAYYVQGYMIANKTYLLASDFVPSNTYKKITSDMNGFCRLCIDKEAYNNWLNMKSDASAIGLNIWIQSGWRSYDYQNDLYNGYVKSRGKTEADRISARPGASEHQTGLAFDLNSVDSSFINTEEGKWVNKNAYLYGYIIRFPKDKDNETGYKYEPWHIRYVGKDLASKLYNNGDWLSLEAYFGLKSEYAS